MSGKGMPAEPDRKGDRRQRWSAPVTVDPGGVWVDLGLPCPVCAVDFGPHEHSLGIVARRTTDLRS